MSGRVALVIGQLGFGGAERQLSLIADGLNRRGWRTEVFCLSHALEPFGAVVESAGVRVRSVRRGGHWSPGRAFWLARGLREYSPDLVHSHLETANIYTSLALGTARTGPGFVASALTIPDRETRLNRFLLSRAYRSADMIHINSRAAIRHYSERYGVDEDRFRVIYNGALPLPQVDEESRSRARHELGIAADAPVIGTLSKDAPYKNVPAFFRLVDELAGAVPGLRALAAGNGLGPDYLDRIEGAAARMRETSILLGPCRDIRPVLAAMDVFVLTSLREGLPNVALEAMQSGLPVVAFGAGGVPELIGHGTSGLVISPGDERAMLDAVRGLLADPEQRRLLGANARSRVEERFGVERMVDETAALYREVLANKAGKRR